MYRYLYIFDLEIYYMWLDYIYVYENKSYVIVQLQQLFALHMLLVSTSALIHIHTTYLSPQPAQLRTEQIPVGP